MLFTILAVADRRQKELHQPQVQGRAQPGKQDGQMTSRVPLETAPGQQSPSQRSQTHLSGKQHVTGPGRMWPCSGGSLASRRGRKVLWEPQFAPGW